MSDDSSTVGRPLPLTVLIGVLVIESIGALAAVALLVVEQFVATPNSRSASLALLGLVVVAFALSVALVIGAVRRRTWIRGAVITWQVLQVATAWVFLQGDMAPWIGWVLIALAVVAVVCAIHPATQRSLRPAA